MQSLIPLISAVTYRLGGCGQDDSLFPFLKPPTPYAHKAWRWFMGVPIALLTGKWWCILTYLIATNVFSYGDKHPISKLFGVRFARLLHGFMFGAASLRPIYGIWCAVVFYIIFELGDHDVLDNSYCEALRGFAGTILWLY